MVECDGCVGLVGGGGEVFGYGAVESGHCCCGCSELSLASEMNSIIDSWIALNENRMDEL